MNQNTVGFFFYTPSLVNKYFTLHYVFNLPLPVTQMAMLLKLQESANYIESPEREGCLDPTLQATF